MFITVKTHRIWPSCFGKKPLKDFNINENVAVLPPITSQCSVSRVFSFHVQITVFKAIDLIFSKTKPFYLFFWKACLTENIPEKFHLI